MNPVQNLIVLSRDPVRTSFEQGYHLSHHYSLINRHLSAPLCLVVAAVHALVQSIDFLFQNSFSLSEKKWSHDISRTIQHLGIIIIAIVTLFPAIIFPNDIFSYLFHDDYRANDPLLDFEGLSQEQQNRELKTIVSNQIKDLNRIRAQRKALAEQIELLKAQIELLGEALRSDDLRSEPKEGSQMIETMNKQIMDLINRITKLKGKLAKKEKENNPELEDHLGAISETLQLQIKNLGKGILVSSPDEEGKVGRIYLKNFKEFQRFFNDLFNDLETCERLVSPNPQRKRTQTLQKKFNSFCLRRQRSLQQLKTTGALP